VLVVKRCFRSAAIVAASVVITGTAPVARAGGFSIFEAGSQATAMGGAFVAQADDPSAMFYNPAGLAGNQKVTAMIGGTVVIFNAKLQEGFAPFPGAGYTADQKKQVLPLPNFYLAYPVGKDMNISLGAWTPFGLSTAWDKPDEFRGRFLSQRVDLRQFALGLQLSAKLADWISVGAGPELRIGDVKLQRNAAVFNPFTAQPVDAAHVDIITNGLATKVSFGLGLLITPARGLRLGGSYHAHVDVEYDGTARFYPLSTGNAQLDAAFAAKIPVNSDVPVSTTIQYPSVVMFGIAYDISDALTLEVDGNYTSWKVFEDTVLTFGTVDGKTPPTSTLVHKWHNTWTVRGGMKVKASKSLNVMAGVYYDQTPQPDEDVAPLLPDANRTGATIGLGLKIGKATTIEASNLFLFFHDRATRTNVDNFNASYHTFADLFAISLRTSF
jgi:long-chain fatty acid transport protein